MSKVKLGRLVFMNAETRPKNILIECSAQSVADIMDWYGGYHEGDRYTVAFNGRNVPMDINGECLLTVDELEKE